MKYTLKRTLAVFLLLCSLCTLLIGCKKSNGEPLLELGGVQMTVNEYRLFLSRAKGSLARYVGSEALTSSFWDTYISLEGNVTYNDYYTAEVLNDMKMYLAALSQFEKLGLSLSDSVVSKIDEEMEALVLGDGDGSKSALNQLLSPYGVNYDILRNVYLMEAKIDALKSHLYGQNGSKISDTVKEQYMDKNYVCFKQIFFAKYVYVYETDAYGNTVYYDESGKAYLYDTKNGIEKIDENGKVVKDKFGNTVYCDIDGKVLYDTENGKKSPVMKDGVQVTKDLSEDEIKKLKENADLLYSQIDDGDYEDFEDLMGDYSQDLEGMEDYPDGYFLSTSTSYNYDYLNEIVKALSKMEIGETELISSSYGYHLIMKYECKDGAYKEEKNAVWFENFVSEIIEYMFGNEMAEFAKNVKILNEDLLGSYDVKSSAVNYYY